LKELETSGEITEEGWTYNDGAHYNVIIESLAFPDIWDF